MQRVVRVNLLGDLVDLQVFGHGVEQNQVGLEMQGGVRARAGCVFLPDQILPGGLEGRSHDRGQMRLVIDQQDAFGKCSRD